MAAQLGLSDFELAALMVGLMAGVLAASMVVEMAAMSGLLDVLMAGSMDARDAASVDEWAALLVAFRDARIKSMRYIHGNNRSNYLVGWPVGCLVGRLSEDNMYTIIQITNMKNMGIHLDGCPVG